jgi:hypothetical protein
VGDSWTFKIGGAFTTAAASKMKFVFGSGKTEVTDSDIIKALAKRVHWDVTGAITFGASSTAIGSMTASGAITLGAGASIAGTLHSTGGAVTLGAGATAEGRLSSDLAGIALGPGEYGATPAIGLTGDFTLVVPAGYIGADYSIVSNVPATYPLWKFSVGGAFTTGAGSQMVFVDFEANAVIGVNTALYRALAAKVRWVVTGAISLGAHSVALGNMESGAAISFGAYASTSGILNAVGGIVFGEGAVALSNTPQCEYHFGDFDTMATAEFTTFVTVEVQACPEFATLDEAERTAIADAFVSSYNSLSASYCDPFFRYVTAANVVRVGDSGTLETFREDGSLPIEFEVSGECRGGCDPEGDDFGLYEVPSLPSSTRLLWNDKALKDDTGHRHLTQAIAQRAPYESDFIEAYTGAVSDLELTCITSVGECPPRTKFTIELVIDFDPSILDDDIIAAYIETYNELHAVDSETCDPEFRRLERGFITERSIFIDDPDENGVDRQLNGLTPTPTPIPTPTRLRKGRKGRKLLTPAQIAVLGGSTNAPTEGQLGNDGLTPGRNLQSSLVMDTLRGLQDEAGDASSTSNCYCPIDTVIEIIELEPAGDVILDPFKDKLAEKYPDAGVDDATVIYIEPRARFFDKQELRAAVEGYTRNQDAWGGAEASSCNNAETEKTCGDYYGYAKLFTRACARGEKELGGGSPCAFVSTIIAV